MNQTETPLTACFVAPMYCKMLAESGLSPHVPYFWKVRNGVADLHSEAFDIDGYYSSTYPHINFIDPMYIMIPAYNIKDVEKLVPGDWTLCLSNNEEYILMPSTLYPIEGCTAARLPDVFAILLHKCIKQNIVDIEKLNLKIVQ